MKKIYFILIIFLMPLVAYSQDNDSISTGSSTVYDEFASSSKDYSCDKNTADSLYAAKLYKDAARGYEWVLKNEGYSSYIYYNLGNCYYRLNELGPAVLNYEKALLLDPSNKDVKDNLALAYSKTVDKYVDGNVMFYTKWFDSVKSSFSSNTWSVIGIVSFILLLAFVSMFFWGKQITLKKVGFYLALLFFVICIIANVMAYSQVNDFRNKEYAIVMTPSITAKSTPSDSGTNLFVIHEGYKVKITDTSIKDWVEISISSGESGWVPRNSIEVI